MQFLPEQLPVGDRGFLCEVVLRDDQGVELGHTSERFEVAEDWTRFPRTSTSPSSTSRPMRWRCCGRFVMA